MNSGKILTGFALVMLSIAMTITPSSAAGSGESCAFGCTGPLLSGEVVRTAECTPAEPGHSGSSAVLSDATYPYER